MYKDIYSLIFYNKKLESPSNRKVAKYGMAIWGNSMQHENDGHDGSEETGKCVFRKCKNERNKIIKANIIICQFYVKKIKNCLPIAKN